MSERTLLPTRYDYATTDEAEAVVELLEIDGYTARREDRAVWTDAPSVAMRRVHAEVRTTRKLGT